MFITLLGITSVQTLKGLGICGECKLMAVPLNELF